MQKVIDFFLQNRLITGLVVISLMLSGLMVAPFDLAPKLLPRYSVAVDAIPDISENQQIIFTQWPGRSPQDIEDQITYPLTTALLGVPNVKTIRSSSVFGFSSIYLIFDEKTEFYWSRSRILEKLNALPAGILPKGVQPALGPDATALGQVFWYTLEGYDTTGKPSGGWDLHELRSIQDFYVRYALMAIEGVAEVASVGGFVKEYQIDVNPYAMQAHGVSLAQIIESIRGSNLDVGAKTIEINRAEYFVRGLGYIKNTADLEDAVVTVNEHVPIRIKDVAVVSVGPATRRGLLDKAGAEAVGGVIVARHGANPMETIKRIEEKITEMIVGMPTKTLSDGRISQLKIIPFYNRSRLINETLYTLKEALTLEVLITTAVMIVMLMNLRASVIVSVLLPVVVFFVFIAMKIFGITANIVSLSGIAIAIGTVVDLGIIFSENLLKNLHLSSEWREEKNLRSKVLFKIIACSAREVSSPILTAVTTTLISFIPVFALQGAEGKLFMPLAFTKTVALIAALFITLTVMPACAWWIFRWKFTLWSKYKKYRDILLKAFIMIIVLYVLTRTWLPLGAGKGLWSNFLFITFLMAIILGGLYYFRQLYPKLLQWCLNHQVLFLIIPCLTVFFGVLAWQGFDTIFGLLKKAGISPENAIYSRLNKTFPGINQEFMPSFDEGAFLLMPTSMPHAGIAENHRVIRQLDMAVAAIPEIDWVVGKLGRATSALDPAPISMYENIIQYKNEYLSDEKGIKLTFKTDAQGRFFIKDVNGDIRTLGKADESYINTDLLIRSKNGRYFRQWRSHIHSTDDIWQEIVAATRLPGVTSAPKLQPIATRLVMLQTGMRAPIGIKVKGKDLQSIEKFAYQLERHIKQVPAVKREAVFAERIVGKPYLQIIIDRKRIARYGLRIKDVQLFIETLIGGVPLDYSVEGRERYAIRLRYPRELRDDPEILKQALFTANNGIQIPLAEIATITYRSGPQMIRSEDTFLTSYVLFDKKKGYSEVQVVESVQAHISEKIRIGELKVPAGVSFKFAGTYENQVHAEKQLKLIIPVCLALIFVILYLQFRSVPITLMIASGIAVAFAGGFLMLWCYQQPWFMNFELFGISMRKLFQISTLNLSVAVWVGFIALFGIATDDGVLIATYLHNTPRQKYNDVPSIRKAVLAGSKHRIRAALMTSATTILALLPILTSTGKGAGIMIPMAIPAFGGMSISLITLFVVPVLYCRWLEKSSKIKNNLGALQK